MSRRNGDGLEMRYWGGIVCDDARKGIELSGGMVMPASELPMHDRRHDRSAT